MRPVVLLSAVLCTVLAAAAGTDAARAASPLEQTLKNALTGKPADGSLKETDAAGGVREALAQGVERAVRQLGKEDGFFRDQAVKILVPPKLRRLADVARQLGAGKKVDAFELSMNRAAEKAVPVAANILADSVRQMSLQDAIGLVRGGDTSATDFFRRTNEQKLYDAFRPIVDKQTASVGVTQKYKDMSKKAGGSALAGALLGDQNGGSTDLDDYVTRRTIDGLFHVIADQEKQIRSEERRVGKEC